MLIKMKLLFWFIQMYDTSHTIKRLSKSDLTLKNVQQKVKVVKIQQINTIFFLNKYISIVFPKVLMFREPLRIFLK